MNECASWQECLDKHYALERTPDRAKVRSLISTAEARIEFYESNKLNDNNVNFIFEGYYSSVLEILHALTLLNGFKVENHICLGYYLRDIAKHSELFRIFDDCRYKRNSLVYYGKRMDFETCSETVEKIKILFFELKKIVTKRGDK